MSYSKPENLIVSFRSTNSILQSYDGTRNAIDINEVRRFSPEVFVKYSASILNAYIDRFFKSLDLCVDYKYTLSKKPEIDSPLEVLLFASSNNREINSLIIDELSCVVDYGFSLTQDGFDLFDTPGNITQLAKEKTDFIDELACVFLEKHGGKNISKPFEWKIGGHNNAFVSFQGRIKPSFINNEVDKSDFIMQAKLDGFKSSEMLIYLQEINSELKLIPASVVYTATKSSLIKSAAEIYSSVSPAYVTVTAFKKADGKGKMGLYIRDIASYEFDELTELSISN